MSRGYYFVDEDENMCYYMKYEYEEILHNGTYFPEET